MGADLIPSTSPVDLIADSIDGLLALAFPRSRALRYAMAVELARSASKYSETAIGGTLYHVAAFGRTQEQASRALAAVRALRGQKGAEYFVRGRQIDEPSKFLRVIACYLQACACADHRAHCHRVIANPFTESGALVSINQYVDGERYVWPCAFMLQWNTPKLQTAHPSSPSDQLQARAVEIGCDICPNFCTSLPRV